MITPVPFIWESPLPPAPSPRSRIVSESSVSVDFAARRGGGGVLPIFLYRPNFCAMKECENAENITETLVARAYSSHRRLDVECYSPHNSSPYSFSRAVLGDLRGRIHAVRAKQDIACIAGDFRFPEAP